MDKRVGSIRDVLVRLADIGLAQMREGQVGQLGDLYNDVLKRFTPASVETIESAFASGSLVGGLLGIGQFLYLETVDEDRPLIPVVSFNYDFRNDRDEFRLRVGLLGRSEDGSLVAVGFRFESPEGSTGLHSYYHAQLSKSLALDEHSDALPIDHWLPMTQPAVPLDANNPVALLVCFLVGLYGPDHVRDLLHSGLLKFMKTSVSEMHSVKHWYAVE